MMNSFFQKYGGRLKNFSFVIMMIIPVFLYFAAIHNFGMAVHILLGLMIANMLLAMKVG
jgi:hypothetical protein